MGRKVSALRPAARTTARIRYSCATPPPGSHEAVDPDRDDAEDPGEDEGESPARRPHRTPALERQRRPAQEGLHALPPDCEEDAEHDRGPGFSRLVHLRGYVRYALSPWRDSSSPPSSSAFVTRTGVTRLMIQSIAYVNANAYADDIVTAATSFPKNAASPRNRPFEPAGFTARLAKSPRDTMPRKPPTPWTPHTSRASSHFRRFLRLTAR